MGIGLCFSHFQWMRFLGFTFQYLYSLFWACAYGNGHIFGDSSHFFWLPMKTWALIVKSGFKLKNTASEGIDNWALAGKLNEWSGVKLKRIGPPLNNVSRNLDQRSVICINKFKIFGNSLQFVWLPMKTLTLIMLIVFCDYHPTIVMLMKLLHCWDCSHSFYFYVSRLNCRIKVGKGKQWVQWGGPKTDKNNWNLVLLFAEFELQAHALLSKLRWHVALLKHNTLTWHWEI